MTYRQNYCDELLPGGGNCHPHRSVLPFRFQGSSSRTGRYALSGIPCDKDSSNGIGQSQEMEEPFRRLSSNFSISAPINNRCLYHILLVKGLQANDKS